MAFYGLSRYIGCRGQAVLAKGSIVVSMATESQAFHWSD